MSLDYSPELLRQHNANKAVRARLNAPPVIRKPIVATVYKYPPKISASVEKSNMSCESLWRDWLAQRHLAPEPRLNLSPREPKIWAICAEVRIQFGVDKMDFLSARRRPEFVVPRQVAMALSKKLTLKSLPEIGRRIGNRDHTTILYGCRKMQPVTDAVAAKLSPDASVAEWVMAMKAEIEITPFARKYTRASIEPAKPE